MVPVGGGARRKAPATASFRTAGTKQDAVRHLFFFCIGLIQGTPDICLRQRVRRAYNKAQNLLKEDGWEYASIVHCYRSRL